LQSVTAENNSLKSYILENLNFLTFLFPEH